ncbi:hypothetical protein VTI74DRAFT_8515 [Chaetomium olivicolor]
MQCPYLSFSYRHHYHNNNNNNNHQPQKPATEPSTTTAPATPLPLLAPLCPGNTFATTPVTSPPCAPVARNTQLATPHSYPRGQHPASTSPTSFPQRNHPVAHPAFVMSSAGGAPATGTTTVTPLPFTTVVIGSEGGQEVVAQSRPVWQHPPPARARQG